MMEKLGIHNTAGLVRYAIRKGIIEAAVFVTTFTGWLCERGIWLDGDFM